MRQTIRNLELLIAPRNGRVLIEDGALPLFHQVFPDAERVAREGECYTAVLAGAPEADKEGEPCAPVRACAGFTLPFLRHGRDGERRYGLLPSMSKPRLVVDLDDARSFRTGITTYRPGKILNRLALGVFRVLGPHWFAGGVLRVSGAGANDVPAMRIARVFDEKARVAATFFGSPGEANTTIIRIVAPRGNAFAKVATGSRAAPFLRNEGQRLRELAKQPLRHAHVPELILETEVDGLAVLYLAEAASGRSRPAPVKISVVQDLLDEMLARGRIEGTLADSMLGKRVAERLSSGRAPPELHRAWTLVLEKMGNRPIPQGLGHGDFTPANVLIDGKRTVVVDWSWSSNGVPVGIDLCRYFFQGSDNEDKEPPRLELPEGLLGSYLDHIGLPKEMAGPLFGAFLVDWIVFELIAGEKVPTAPEVALYFPHLERVSAYLSDH